MTSYPDLVSKKVAITGGASGLGFAMARGFLAEGARVHLIDLAEDALSVALSSLEADGFVVTCSVASVSNRDEIESAFTDCDKLLGGVDILVNNAGISGACPTLNLEDSQWQHILDVNLTGMFLSAREAGRRMCQQRSGVILNTSSIYGVVAAPERLGYCVTKSGVASMTKSLSVEWAAYGVRVNALAPGYVRTAMVEELLQRGVYDIGAIEKRTPMGRLGTPSEVADAALFLASERASYITGQILCIDGGWTAYGYF